MSNRINFQSAKAAVYMLHALHALFPEELEWREGRMDGLWKTKMIREKILSGMSPEEIIVPWSEELDYFQRVREQYLLY